MTHVAEGLRALGRGVPAQAEQTRSNYFRAGAVRLEGRGHAAR